MKKPFFSDLVVDVGGTLFLSSEFDKIERIVLTRILHLLNFIKRLFGGFVPRSA
jgi:hypothetical protein